MFAAEALDEEMLHGATRPCRVFGISMAVNEMICKISMADHSKYGTEGSFSV
jgi:hypothetical protein